MTKPYSCSITLYTHARESLLHHYYNAGSLIPHNVTGITPQQSMPSSLPSHIANGHVPRSTYQSLHSACQYWKAIVMQHARQASSVSSDQLMCTA